MTALPTIPHWIEGAEVVADDARTAPVFDPALGREVRRAALASCTTPGSPSWSVSARALSSSSTARSTRSAGIEAPSRKL